MGALCAAPCADTWGYIRRMGISAASGVFRGGFPGADISGMFGNTRPKHAGFDPCACNFTLPVIADFMSALFPSVVWIYL